MKDLIFNLMNKQIEFIGNEKKVNSIHPKLSVIVPTYNHRDFIADCLNGILNQQTNFDFEIIIADDGSDDGTTNICKEFASRWQDKIRLFVRDRNESFVSYDGKQVMINSIMAVYASKGKYIAWCDGDDFWSHENKLQLQVDVLDQNESISLCFHKMNVQNEITGERKLSNDGTKTITNIFDLAAGNYIHTSSAVFRREIYPLDPEILLKVPARDYVLWMIAASIGDIHYLDIVMGTYRVHSEGLWENKPIEYRFDEWLKVQNVLLGMFGSEIDDIIYVAKADIYYQLAYLANKNNNNPDLKRFLTLGLEACLEAKDSPELNKILNKIVINLRAIIKVETDSRELLLMGKLARRKGLNGDAVKFFENVRRIEPDNFEAMYELADLKFSERDFNGSFEIFKELFVLHKKNLNAIILFAKLCLVSGRYLDELVAIMNKFVGDGKDNFDFLKYFGLALNETNDKQKAFEMLNLAKGILNYDVEVLLALSKLNQELPFGSLKNAIPPQEVTSEYHKPALQIQNPTKINQNSKEPTITIVIPVFNKLEFTRKCIESIYTVGSRYIFDIIVVDNASSDGTLEFLKDLSLEKSNFKFHRNHQNLGFAKACNLGIRFSDTDFIVLLNNDTIAKPNWLDNLVDAAMKDEKVAIAGSLLFYEDERTIQHCGVRLGNMNGILSPYHINKLRDIKYVPEALVSSETNIVTGACLLLREKYLANIGLLDESFENGYEDVDLCLRARSQGYKVLYVAESALIHYESMTPNRHDNDKKNLDLFNKKWLGKFEPDISDNEFWLTSLNIWYREELLRNPDEVFYLFKLIQVLNYIESFEEVKIYEEKLKSKLAMKTNIINFKTLATFIVIVRDNLEYTKTFLDSLFETVVDISYEIIIIDNASGEPTRSYLEQIEKKSEFIRVLRNQENMSFAKANNKAAAIANGKYLFFINNDIKLLEGSIKEMIDTFEMNDDISIQGAKLLYPDDSIQHAGVVWGPLINDEQMHYHIYLGMPDAMDCVNISRQYQFVTGALMAIRQETFILVGKFDENYHFGHEDLDLCLKVRQLNKKVWYNHLATAYHYESITKKSEGIEKFERFIVAPNSFDKKNHEYFLQKWSDYVVFDADEYFLNDGMLAYVSDKALRTDYISRLNKITQDIVELKNKKNIELFSKLVKVLFGSDVLTQHSGKLNLGFIPSDKLKLAEMMFNENQDDSFDIYDIFEDKDNEKINKIEKQTSVSSSLKNNNTKQANETIGQAPTCKKFKGRKVLMTMYGWNESGGGTTFPKAVAKELVKRGARVAVLYATAVHPTVRTPYYVEHLIEDGVELYGIYNRPTIFLDADNPYREKRDDNVVQIFENLIHSFIPDIIHFHNFLGLSFEIARIAAIFKIPTFYTPYNYHLIDPMLYLYRSDLSLWKNTDIFSNSELIEKYPILQTDFMEREIAARRVLNEDVNYILAVSNRVKDILVEFGADSSKIAVVHQVHDTINKLLESPIKHEKTELPLKFGFIGGVMPHKGAHLIVQAAQLVPKGKAEFHIYGFVSDYYEKILKSLDRNEMITMHGEYQSSALPEIASSLDAMILPSLWEDCAPFVITESLAMNLPVICTKIGGFPDFITDKVNGRLFAYNSSTELAQIINEMIQNPSIIDFYRSNIHININFEQHINQIIDIYKTVIINKNINIQDYQLLFNG